MIFKNRIYFGSFDCHLYCLTLEGKLLWRFRTSILKQTEYYYEEETLIEFKPPEVEETKDEEKDRYEVKAETIVGDTYKAKSEYQMEVHYASKGGEYK
ncbi:MAG: hypothetical protein JSV39_01340 [Candidatus Aenigmatarchaeota archaeon]|nr:MAG: hypothetical protein JSV39_01340 [Candidatus Aenigmarchaeota archaeon]